MFRAFLLFFLLSFSLTKGWTQINLNQLTYESDKMEWQLGDLLKDIQTQTGVNISYSSSQLDLSQKIILPLKQLNLVQCFEEMESSANLKVIQQNNKILIAKNYLSGSVTLQKSSLSGFVRDAVTGEKLIGANILLLSDSRVGITDLNGYFFLEYPMEQERYTFIISYVGYKNLVIQFSGSNRFQSDYFLEPGANFNPVIIYDRFGTDIFGFKDFESSKKQAKFQFIPGSFGGIDIFKELALMPGVLKTTDLQSGVSIRGFGSAHTNYLIDGIHLYEPNHSFGLFSVFNHQAVNHVELFKQDIPFEYSGRLSGVVNHELKNGNIHHWQGNIGLNAAAMELTLQGPIIAGKTSMMLSSRKSLLDAWLPAFVSKLSEYQTPSVDFWDVHVKITHQINPRHKIEILSLQYKDKVAFSFSADDRTIKNQVRWGSNLGGIRWVGVFGNKLSVSSQFAWSNFNNFKNSKSIIFLTDQDTVYSNILGQSAIKDLMWHNQSKFYFSNDLQLKTGLKASVNRLRPSLYKKINFDIEDLEPFLESGKDTVFYAVETYADLNYSLNDFLALGAGIQLKSLFLGDVPSQLFLNPVFRLNYRPLPAHLINFSLQKLHQAHHLLLQNSYGLSSDFWLPVTEVLPAEQMWQLALDYRWKINQNIDYQLNTYCRKAYNMAAFRNPGDQYDPLLDRGIILPVFTDSGEWEEKVITHEAFSSGIEQELSFKWKQFSLSTAYSFGKTVYQELVNDQVFSYPGDFDVPHAVNIFLKYVPLDGFSCFVSWQYHSGRPVSLPVDGYLNHDGQWILDFGQKNAWRIASYQSLDAGFSGSNATKEWVLEYAFGLTNILNHENPLGNKLYLDDASFNVLQINGFPILPYLRFNLFIK